MKKIFLIFTCISMLLMMASCGGETGGNQKDTPSTQTEDTTGVVDPPEETTAGTPEDTGGGDLGTSEYDKNDPDSILAALETALKSAGKTLESGAEALIRDIGESYDAYKEQQPSVEAFYTGAIENAEKLYADIGDMVVDYFRCVAAHGLDEYKVWDRAMEDLYDVWDDGMEDYYDSWTDSFEDLYNKCGRIIEDEADDLQYNEYSDNWSKNYDAYSNAWSEMYDAYSDAWSDIYDRYSAVWSGFYDGKTDVDAILKEAVESGSQEGSMTPPTTEPSPETTPPDTAPEETAPPDTAPEDTGAPPVDGIRPEFKKAMDEYEAFYREYVDFMKRYQESDYSLSMLSDYLSMLERLENAENALGNMREGEMSSEELKYYGEVTLRIAGMLEEIV